MAINEDVSAIDKHVTKKYEIIKKLGKGVRAAQRNFCSRGRPMALCGKRWIRRLSRPLP